MKEETIETIRDGAIFVTTEKEEKEYRIKQKKDKRREDKKEELFKILDKYSSIESFKRNYLKASVKEEFEQIAEMFLALTTRIEDTENKIEELEKKLKGYTG